jgi:hypothetical protein
LICVAYLLISLRFLRLPLSLLHLSASKFTGCPYLTG